MTHQTHQTHQEMHERAMDALERWEDTRREARGEWMAHRRMSEAAAQGLDLYTAEREQYQRYLEAEQRYEAARAAYMEVEAQMPRLIGGDA
jgi:hypothetical protein